MLRSRDIYLDNHAGALEIFTIPLEMFLPNRHYFAIDIGQSAGYAIKLNNSFHQLPRQQLGTNGVSLTREAGRRREVS